MKCLNCSADIPPSFVHALEANICPGCGSEIMDDASKNLLNELKEAMTKMPNDPQGLAGWLLSNYTLVKIGTAEPTTFHRKVVGSVQSNGKSSSPGRKIKIARNSVQDFLKRKDPNIAKSVESQRELADIVSELNNGIGDPYGNGVPLETEIDEEENQEFSGEVVYEDQEEYGDPEEDEAYQEAAHNRRNFQSKSKALARHSLVVPGNSKPLSAAETAAMMHAVAGKVADADLGDGSGMPEVLQLQRIERLKKQRAVAEGGTSDYGSGLGSFRRH